VEILGEQGRARKGARTRKDFALHVLECLAAAAPRQFRESGMGAHQLIDRRAESRLAAFGQPLARR
jgi:hypothetical protein